MIQDVRFLVIALVTGLASPSAVRCDDKLPRPLMGCAAAVDNYFEDEVWAKVGVRKCLTCHRKGGDAESSKGVVMLDDRRLLRRVTLSLAGRLPTDAEFAAIAKDGLKAMPAILDAVMKEDAFYDRLREGFNDIFLTVGIDGNADQTVLSYEHFEKTRHWTQKQDLSHIKDKAERQRAEWKLAAE